MRAKWPLAVCGVMPATRANSDAVSARPSINAWSIAARAGSPARAATSANTALLAIADILDGRIASYARRHADASAATVTCPDVSAQNAGMHGTRREISAKCIQ